MIHNVTIPVIVNVTDAENAEDAIEAAREQLRGAFKHSGNSDYRVWLDSTVEPDVETEED